MILAGVCVLLHFVADRWWPTTLLVYGPKWLAWLPLAVFAVAALLLRSGRVTAAVLIGGLLIVRPLLEFRFNWPADASRRPEAGVVRVLTCNVHGSALRQPELQRLIDSTGPDLVTLQEWPNHNELIAGWRAAGWHVRHDGELCLASRWPILDAEVLGYDHVGGKGTAARYHLQADDGPLCVFNVHLASARPALEAFMERKWRARSAVEANTALRWEESRLVSAEAGRESGRVVVAGDFNLPEESAVYEECWSRWLDAHATAGCGFGYSWYTSRLGALRIDHVLTGAGGGCRRCWVGPDVGSDHRPVVADLIPGTGAR